MPPLNQHKISRRSYTIWAFSLSIVATVVGYYQIGAKIFPPMHLVLWFPSIAITGTLDSEPGVMLMFLQFPLLALLFVIGIRRWAPLAVFSAIAFAYGLMVFIAWTIAKGG